MLTDSHAHLDMEDSGGEVREVIARAAEAGVTRIIAVGASEGMQSNLDAIRIARENERVWATVGIHPHQATLLDPAAIERLEHLARDPKVVAVGETGLDYHYDASPRPVQQAAFRRQIALALEAGLPLVVHTREATRDTLRILDEAGGGGLRFVVHCFTGDEGEAREVLARGGLVSFTGVVTFPRSETLRQTVASVPVERILVETDSPFLAPVPFRGRRNEPAHVREVARRIAEIKGLTLEDVARITTRNALRFFGIGEAEENARIAYRIRDSLYLNLTNRCTLACTFCGKRRDWVVKGHSLELSEGEPTVEEVLAAIGDPRGKVREIVFCGYGEPLLRLDAVKTIARRMKEIEMRVRVNTDGLANLVHGRDVTAELAGLVDCVSVSLNAPDAETYARLCPSRHGPVAYPALLDFVRRAKGAFPEVVATVVTVPGLDLGACRRVAADLGVALRLREYDEIG